MRQMLAAVLSRGSSRWAAAAIPFVLVLFGLIMALSNEAAYNQQKAREIGVQAQIVSASVAPALIFLNSESAQQYLEALSANPDVSAAAVYDLRGARVASYQRAGEAPPPETAAPHPPRFEQESVVAVTAVTSGGEQLGAVYLRTQAATTLQRFARYAGIGILILLAALVLAIFGVAQAALREANRELEERAAQLQQEIEHRERAEEALLQSQKMEAIGQLTGGVAHDFNNLLTVVLSGIRLMERNDDPKRRAATFEAMRQAVERGAGLTRQLLAFARRQTLKLEPIDIAARLKGMRELLERSLRADILVDINAAAELWPVKTDPTQFELAILNLAVNARDAMPKGGVLTINASNVRRSDGEFVEVRVRDTGLGMPPEVVKRVFEPYFTTKQVGQGTGLGLAQVYGIVTQSGGRIRIESAVNEGACVIMDWPRSAEEVAIAAPIEKAANDARALAGKRVLVVEDDDAVAGVVQEMLESLGCAPTRVANASAALAAIESGGRSFDLVFSDIVMPGAMNGIELARALRAQRPGLPIVLTTGYSGAGEARHDFPVLNKPYIPEDLEKMLTQALSPGAPLRAQAGADG